MKRRFTRSYLPPRASDVEEFRPAPGYAGLYFVSNLGRIFSAYTGFILRANPDSHGRLCCGLCDAEGRATVPVHKLVALAFVENPSAMPEVDHKDGDFTNNHASNLEWVTNEENRRRYQERLTALGDARAQVPEDDALAIFTLRAFGATRRALAETFGRNEKTIAQIYRGRHPATAFARNL